MRSGKKGTEIIFDRNKRVEFVTGFKRRKDERRVIAKQKLKEEQADERRQNRQIKYKNRERIEEQYEQLRSIMRIGEEPEPVLAESGDEEAVKYEKC